MAPPPSASAGQASTGAKKRKTPHTQQDAASFKSQQGRDNNNNTRGHKRTKVQDARSLRTQPADAALKDGSLDLQAFLSAREYEIRALTAGMSASKNANNRRAFQLVPRSMRRRTASHNVKKLPKRLRPRARREQVDDNTPKVEARRRKPKTTRARIRAEAARRLGILAGKKKRRRLREAKERAKNGEGAMQVDAEESAAIKQLIKTRPARPKIRRNLLNEPPKPKARFRKRQINKTWMPTHLWHAKRAKMTPPKEPLWRFAIPLTPNEKVYRPTHRASTVKGAMIWDMSYMSTIGLYGHEAGLQRVLKAQGLSHESLWDTRGLKWRQGRRKWSGMLSKEKDNIRQPIGPGTVIWNPESAPDTSHNPEELPQSAQKPQRQVYIRLHPSCFLDVFNNLTTLIKRETPRVYIEDLRFEIGSIELTGPAALEAILGSIRPYHQEEETKEPHASLFVSLKSSICGAVLASDAVLGFSIQDPRLHHPPRAMQASTTQSELSAESPDEPPRPFLLFDRNARFTASCFPSQKALNRRKGANPTPGQALRITKADPPFPIILLSSRSKPSTQATWTLLAPWKCILPIWYSLVHYPLSTGGNPRVGGLDELRQVAFERGLPWFPGDYPGTQAGAQWELEQRRKRKAEWARRPRAKRVAWETLDLGAGRKGEIGLGWACEFERLFGLQQADDEMAMMASVDEDKDVEMTDADAVVYGTLQPTNSGEEGRQASKKEQTSSHPMTQVHHLSKTAFNTLLLAAAEAPTDATEARKRPPNAIVAVKITFPGRGVVKPCARIYRLPSTPTSQPPVALEGTLSDSAGRPTPSTAANASTSPITTPKQPEVPATFPPSKLNQLPPSLRQLWLAKLPNSKNNALPCSDRPTNQRPRRLPVVADQQTQRRLLLQSLVTNKVPFPPAPPPFSAAEKHATAKSTGTNKTATVPAVTTTTTATAIPTTSTLPAAENTLGATTNADHPLVPDEDDLIGYVTKGEFNLAQGRGVAIGSLSVERALEALVRDKSGKNGEGRVCVVRNAGETIGWIGRWEVI